MTVHRHEQTPFKRMTVIKSERRIPIAIKINNMLKHLAKDAPNDLKRIDLPIYNPANDVVISRGELEALNSLKSNSDVLQVMAKQVEQLHKLQTGELFNPDKVKKKLTPKEKREKEEKESEARIQTMINKRVLRTLGNL